MQRSFSRHTSTLRRDKMVGDRPFETVQSMFGIGVFVLVASQLLGTSSMMIAATWIAYHDNDVAGNVAVVQLAQPNVTALGAHQKMVAWSIISFVATIAGNLTITGSAGRDARELPYQSHHLPFLHAANIIVAEKVAKLDPESAIDFFKHARICAGVTIVSCIVGAAIIAVILS